MSEKHSNPPASGVRQQWNEMPETVRAAVEDWLGSRVVNAASQSSGFSPGVAARLRTANGRRVFLKAASPNLNALAPVFHRREGLITAALPPTAPVPRLLFTYDEGPEGWIVLVFEEVEGQHPAHPWRLDELERILAAQADLAAALTPSPLPPGAVPSASEMIGVGMRGWLPLVEADRALAARLDDWSRRNLERLVALEDQAAQAVAGDTLIHGDVRADNLLLSAEKVWFLDWPHACLGAPWLDVAFFAPSIAMQGGPDGEWIVAHSRTLQAADPEKVTAAVALAAGYFIHRSLQPPLPGLPTLRAFQAAQGKAARAWLRQRTGWA